MKFLISILCLSILFIKMPFCQPLWVMEKTQSINYDSVQLHIIEQAFKDELETQGKVRILPLNTAVDTIAQARMDSLNANQAVFGISGSINKINETIFLNIEKYNQKGESVFKDHFTVQENEEIDVLIKRVAKSLIDEIPFKTTAETETITKRESQLKLRMGGNILLIGRVGFLYPLGESFRPQRITSPSWGVEDTTYEEGSVLSMEAGFLFDVNWAIFEATMNFDANRALYFTVGGEYPLSKKNISPYVGGEVSIALVNKEFESAGDDRAEKGSDGIALGGRAGLLFLRNHQFHFFLETRGLIVLNKDFDSGLRVTVGLAMY